MTIKDAHKYIKKYIDHDFIIQNINNKYSCDELINAVKELIKTYGKKKECRLYYIYENGIAIMDDVELLDCYSTEYDTDYYNYIITNLGETLKIFSRSE